MDNLRKTMINKFFNELRIVTDQRFLVNLSFGTLLDPFVSLLSKGLKLVLTPNPVTWQTLLKSFLRFYPTMCTKYYFYDYNTDNHFPFKSKIPWDPPLPDNYNLLAYISSDFCFLKCLYSDINHLPYPINLTQQEMSFLSYKTSCNYVIKPDDKGGAIVIWSSVDYETEALSQLNNPQNYEALQLCPRTVINELYASVSKFLQNMYLKKFNKPKYIPISCSWFQPSHSSFLCSAQNTQT